MKHTLLARACCLSLALVATGGLALAAQDETAEDRAQQEIQDRFRKDMTKVEALIIVDRDLEQAHAQLIELIGALAEGAGKEVSADMLQALSQLVIEETLEGKGLGAAAQDPLAVLAQMERTASFNPAGDFFIPSRGEATSDEGQTSQDRMESMVRESVKSGGHLIHELGSVTGPTLAKLVEEDLGSFPGNVSKDPLYYLMRVDPPRAGELATRHLGSGEIFFRKRVARAAANARFFSDENLHKYGGRSPVIGALESMLQDPELRESVQRGFSDYADTRPLTPVMTEVFLSEVSSEVDAERERAMSVLPKGVVFPSDVATLEKLLLSPYEDVRIFAAGKITQTGKWNDALAASTHDPALPVRKAIASMLVGRESRTGKFRPIQNLPAFMALFEALAFDEDVAVRARVAESLVRLPRSRNWTSEYEHGNSNVDKVEVFESSPGPASLLHLGRDHSTTVNEHILEYLGAMPIEVCESLIGSYLSRQNQHRLWEAISRLRPRTRPEQTAQVLYDVTGSDHAMGSWDLVMWENLQSALRDQPGGSESLLRTIVNGDDPVVGAGLLQELHVETFGNVPAPLFEAAIRLLDGTRESRPVMWEILRSIPDSDILLATAKKLARDPSLSAEARFWASMALHDVDVGQFVSGVREGLASFWWRERGLEDVDLNNFLYSLVPTLRADSAALDAVSLALVKDPRTNMHVIGAFTYESMSRGSAATSKAILAERFTQEDAEPFVRAALLQMTQFPRLRDDDQLKRAVRSGQAGLAAEAAGVIGRLQDPALFPLLVECVETYPGEEPWTVSVRASVGFLSGDAAHLLLRAAELATTNNERSQCFRQLEVLREFSQARDYWRRNQITSRERTSVVADLLSLLAADQPDDVRIEAARGLATYKAEEAIPDLIRLMQEDSDLLRKAAKQALDRINEPIPLKPQTPPSDQEE